VKNRYNHRDVKVNAGTPVNSMEPPAGGAPAANQPPLDDTELRTISPERALMTPPRAAGTPPREDPEPEPAPEPEPEPVTGSVQLQALCSKQKPKMRTWHERHARVMGPGLFFFDSEESSTGGGGLTGGGVKMAIRWRPPGQARSRSITCMAGIIMCGYV
jgi:hypothetical protein